MALTHLELTEVASDVAHWLRVYRNSVSPGDVENRPEKHLRDRIAEGETKIKRQIQSDHVCGDGHLSP